MPPSAPAGEAAAGSDTDDAREPSAGVAGETDAQAVDVARRNGEASGVAAALLPLPVPPPLLLLPPPLPVPPPPLLLLPALRALRAPGGGAGWRGAGRGVGRGLRAGARLGWRGAAWGGRACVAGCLAAVALAVELVAVPVAAGWGLDAASLAAVGGTWSGRCAFAAQHPAAALLLHWLAGLGALLAAAVVFSEVRACAGGKVLGGAGGGVGGHWASFVCVVCLGGASASFSECSLR
jgi:hypothetical protein